MPQNISKSFLQNLVDAIKSHISNENFGVSELAEEVNMSRSNLLRRVKKLTNVSVSQFIREVRLREAMDILQYSDQTVSEVGYKVGFSSTSYFIKCFHDYYGYTPGDVEKLTNSPSSENTYYPHELVAVVFTDIQGYTAIMQENEKKALAFINKHREIFSRITKKYKGRIIQYYGDGTLSVFHSVIDAVNSSIEMQSEFLESPEIPVRIGIHSGDVIFNKNGIIGDGVNIASRVESLGISGAILISEKVYDEVKNQPGISTISLGVHTLKNVLKPLEVYAINNPGLKIPQLTNHKKIVEKIANPANSLLLNKRWKWFAFLPIVLITAFLLGENYLKEYLYNKNVSLERDNEKSIAVLPFINDSNDSSNVYIINGLMESILNNLQHIEEIRVISRTSIEKYRTTDFLIPQIARDLNVKYIVEGSGQKIGDQILLNIQLINGQEDTNLWSGQYKKETKDIFDLQLEVAEDIAKEIAVIITPEEKEIITRIPTDNLIAYDYFLKAREYMQQGTREGLIKSLPFFHQAIKNDEKFALAHAYLAISFYYLDALQANKLYLDSINYYADKAILYDDRLPQSMLAKALHYINNRNYSMAIPYLEKAHKAHPHSIPILNMLADFYTTYVPNTEKYLEYALKGTHLDITSYDSTSASFAMLHISNALVQSGFTKESKLYIQKSLSLDPDNLFADYLSAYVNFAGNKNLLNTRRHLKKTLKKDTTRVDILQEIGKTSFYLRDYSEAAIYYQKYLDLVKSNDYSIYPDQEIKISKVFREIGKIEESINLLDKFGIYATNDKSIYKELSLATYYAEKGQKAEAIEHFIKFSKQELFNYWNVLFLPIDPLLDPIKDDPEVVKAFSLIRTKFEIKHKKLKLKLEAEGLL
jgi:TolB-like protein/class 3 adenylate cyclase